MTSSVQADEHSMMIAGRHTGNQQIESTFGAREDSPILLPLTKGALTFDEDLSIRTSDIDLQS